MRRRAALCAVLLAGCVRDPTQDGPPDPPSSIVLITIDTLRADHLPTYGYFRDTAPGIDAFASGAIVFENAVTPMATTLPAHTSIMTGVPPLRHGVVRNGLVFEPDEGIQTVAEALAAAGYQTSAVVSASPLAEGTGIAAGFRRYDDAKSGPRRAEVTTDLALAEVDRFDGAPFFLWVHYWDPHDPYEPPPPYDRRYGEDDGLRAFVEGTGTKLVHRIGNVTFEVLEINNLYDGEIAYADHHIDRFLEGLEERDLFDRTAIVVTADHGEGLWQHEWHDHGLIYNEQIFVPLIVKPPSSLDLPPRRVPRIASTLDIFPTLAAMLHLPLGPRIREQFEGIDLLDEESEREYVLSERVHRYRKGWERGNQLALTGLDHKLFTLTDAAPRLFDMRADRHELVDLAAVRPWIRLGLERQLNGLLARYATAEQRQRRDVSPELIEELKGLGYLQ